MAAIKSEHARDRHWIPRTRQLDRLVGIGKDIVSINSGEGQSETLGTNLKPYMHVHPYTHVYTHRNTSHTHMHITYTSKKQHTSAKEGKPGAKPIGCRPQA